MESASLAHSIIVRPRTSALAETDAPACVPCALPSAQQTQLFRDKLSLLSVNVIDVGSSAGRLVVDEASAAEAAFTAEVTNAALFRNAIGKINSRFDVHHPKPTTAAKQDRWRASDDNLFARH